LYLRTRLSRIVAERSHWDGTVPWPGDEEIKLTIKICSGLFIVAYIIVKHVSHRLYDPEERLTKITSNLGSSILKGELGLDRTYDIIFNQGFKEIGVEHTKFYVDLRLVIGSIVVVFDPLSCASLAAIFGIKKSRVWTILSPLHSIFIVPDTESKPMRICHKSLADYLQDRTRCKDARFYVNPLHLHMELGLRCLRLMNIKLKKNICELPRFSMNAEVHDLDARRKEYIGEELEYGCKSWAKHLRLASKDGENARHVIESLRKFFDSHLLEWLEVLSIVGDLHCAVYSLRDVTAWLVDVSMSLFFSCRYSLSANIQAKASDADLIAIVKDSERFVLRFFDVIELSAIHIYKSALPLSPSSSLVQAQYLDQVSKDVKFKVVDKTWDACIRTIRSQSSVHMITFSHKDDLVAVGEEDVVEVFEAVTGQRRATLMTNYIVTYLAFSPDDNVLSIKSDDNVDVWDLQTGGVMGTLKGHTEDISSITFSPCGNMIATCSGDCTIRIWNTFSFDCRFVLKDHSQRVWTICWSASGNEVISGSLDKTVKLWRVSDKQTSLALTILTGGPVYSVASSPYSSLIAAGSGDGIVKLFDAETGHVLHTVSTNLGDIDSIRFLNRDQIMCLTNNGGMFGIWDLKKSVDVLAFKYERCGRAMSSDGTHVVSSQSNVVKICQRDTPMQNRHMDQDTPIQNKHDHRTKPVTKMLKRMKSAFTFPYRKNHAEMLQESEVAPRHTDKVTCIAFSEDGQLVASGSMDDTVKIWDTSTGQCLTTFHGHRSRVFTVTFSSNSRLCASWGYDYVIRIWEVRTSNPAPTFERSSMYGTGLPPTHIQLVSLAYVHGMHFSPDDRQLVSLSHDDVKLWDVARGVCLASMEVNPQFTSISFGVDWASIVLKDSDDNIQRWALSRDPDHIDDATIPLPRLPIVFLPVKYTETPNMSSHQYHLDERNSWVLDEQNRRMIWVPPDLKCFCDGKRVVYVSDGAVRIFIDFSSVRKTWPK
jgi:WD40 repeat protein